MRRIFHPRALASATALALLSAAGFVNAEAAHGIAMYGTPALPPDFVSLPYVNADAPQGGRIVLGEKGGFDSLNPFILKGNAPWGMRMHGYESLMGRSWDEPFALYGLLAESVETDPNRTWVEFTLRPEARFSDGSPVTVEDVLWSFETLGTRGHPRYLGAWAKVARAEAVGPRTVRFTFNTQDRELPLILGLRPVLKKAQWEGRDFAAGGLEAPIGTGPYVITAYEPGRYLVMGKNPDWWGRDLPLNRGQHNFAEIRYEFYKDDIAMFEDFKGGAIDVYREPNDARWDTVYDFPAIASGAVVKSEVPNRRPSGIAGFVMNTRRPVFTDWRVRDAMIHAFNFEFINGRLTGGKAPRITSYFSNSDLAMRPGPAEGRVRELLDPFASSLLPGALDGYALPVTNGRRNDRTHLATVFDRMNEAGWQVVDGVFRDAKGAPFTFDILLSQTSNDAERIAEIFRQTLAERYGIRATITTVDSAQYTERTDAYDFDMAFYGIALSLSPGNEQRLYWGSDGVTRPGTRNWMGVDSPAAEAMIDALLTAESEEDFTAATRALDRVLTTGRYVIPIWYTPQSHIAHRARLKYPETVPIYGDWIGFLPDIWWSEGNEK